jgi:CRP-like cAMP-binding protein
MRQVASYETYQDGQIIFNEEDSGDWIYTIDSGSVELSKMVGETMVVIEVLHEDDVFGEMAFIGNIPRTATARAVGKTTVGILDRSFLDEEYNKLSANFRSMLKGLVTRLKRTTDMVARLKIKQ